MPVELKGATSGSVTLAAPAVAGSNTLTLPAATDTITTNDATQTLTNKTLTSPTITGASVSSMASSVLTRMTSQASTSGTSINFTGIPSWVKRITVMFQGVSTSGTSVPQVQIGTSSSVETSGYAGTTTSAGATALASYNSTTGVTLQTASESANHIRHGSIIICNISGNIWAFSGTVGLSNDNRCCFVGYSKSLSGTLDRVRITTVNGTDTFDAGTINVMYE